MVHPHPVEAAPSSSPPVPPAVAEGGPQTFPGWWIVLGAAVAQFVVAGQTQAIGVFLTPMTDELGWTRGEVSLGVTLGALVTGAVAVAAGARADRGVVRPLVVLGATVSGAGLLAMSRVEEPWHFLVLRGLVVSTGTALIGAAVLSAALGRRLVERRPAVPALAVGGFLAWGALGTPLVALAIDAYGWRDAWLALAFGTWALVYPVALVVRRRSDHPRAPDGAGGRRGGEALRHPSTWLLAGGFGLALAGVFALQVHLVPLLTDAGYERDEAVALYAVQGLAALAALLPWSLGAGRASSRWLAPPAFAITAAATAGLALAVREGGLVPAAGVLVAWGVGVGGIVAMASRAWTEYARGRDARGVVRPDGAAVPYAFVVEAAGPLFAGRWFDEAGSYEGALLALAGATVVGALLVLVARRPERPREFPVPLAHRLRRPEPEARGMVRASVEEPEAASSAVTPVSSEVPPQPVEPLTTSEPGAPSTAQSPGEGEPEPVRARRRPHRSYMGEAAAGPPPRETPEPAPPSPLAEAPSEPPSEPPVEPALPAERALPVEPRDAGTAGAPAAQAPAHPVAELATPTPGSPPPEAPVTPAPTPPAPPPRPAAREAAAGRDSAGAGPPSRKSPEAVEPYGAVARYMPRSTSSAVLAGVAASVVATAAVWLLTRPHNGRRG